MSILQPKKKETAKLALKVSPTLIENIKNLESRIAQQAPTLCFNADSIAKKAIDKAIKQANKELESMGQETRNG